MLFERPPRDPGITRYCHMCNSGPYNIATESGCTNVLGGRQCDHVFCGYCRTDAGFRSRTSRGRRTDKLKRSPSPRADPNIQHVNTSPPNSQPSGPHSSAENLVSENQVINITAPATAQPPHIQLNHQHPVLLRSESTYSPYYQQYTRFQRSFRRFLKLVRTCHTLIFLGVLTIIGSLGAALWRSVAYDDIQGGFSLAQYILGVGVFVIGCIVAIHAGHVLAGSSNTIVGEIFGASLYCNIHF